MASELAWAKERRRQGEKVPETTGFQRI